MQISRRERTLILIGVPVVLAVLAFNFLIPANPAAAKGGQVPKKQAEDRTKTAEKTVQKMKAEEKEVKPRIVQMAYNEPAEELVPQMIRDLQTTAEKSGIHLREIKPLRPGLMTGKNGTRVPLEVHFRAPFQPNAVKFLYFVEDPTGKMVVEKLDITSADAKFKTVDVTAQISVFTRAQTKDTGNAEGDTRNAKDKNDKS